MAKILVTGGCGYIGSHTIVDLVENGYEVICADNLSHSSTQRLDGIEAITGTRIKNYAINLADKAATEVIFQENPDLAGIIHFAAFMSVPESVQQPLRYFENNLNSLINVLHYAEKLGVKNFVFSSSCSVYGQPDELPVTEQTPRKEAESPYARTKQIGEDIIRDFIIAQPEHRATLLRYFNPIGAHPSGQLGEYATFKPNSLAPLITDTALGKRESLNVYGNDYPTKDGTCVRDYIHVSDIGHAHTLAIKRLLEDKAKEAVEVFNLGSGEGSTVVEVIEAFEESTGVKLNWQFAPRRPGDVIAVYADRNKATQELGWNVQYSLHDMMQTAWKWALRLSNELGGR
ncbi:UDP-glucose 4-epimerase GalE [soil metagenome]